MQIPQLTQIIVSVALGQDHTLAVTKSGEVLSWGLNRFSQLGYVIEQSLTASGVSLGRSEELIQASPRRIFGPLKKEIVEGVAACKTASACWTDREVFTWGTNHGQLG
jgi:alpha-tubulin suppressor-like RCC1 family protein